MSQIKPPLIFDIKRTSTTDGPGIRTVVFFKGCNLDCFWCHNPEGKSSHAEIAYFREKCIACGECYKKCDRTKDACIACGQCVESCPVGAKKMYGRDYSSDALFEVIQRDRAYYEATGGGVTFSGGECMLYPEYLMQIASQCKKEGISVAIDTAGCVPYENFAKLLPYTDLFLYDLKAMNPKVHQKGTGKNNVRILENLERLLKDGARVLIRIPVIPNFNKGEEVEKIQAYCRDRGLPFETLTYHTYGEAKKDALQELN